LQFIICVDIESVVYKQQAISSYVVKNKAAKLCNNMELMTF